MTRSLPLYLSALSSNKNDNVETTAEQATTTTTTTKKPGTDDSKSVPSKDSYLLKLLQQALDENFESASAKELLEDLSALRSSDPIQREELLDDLLAQGPDNVTRRVPRFLTRFSKRARWASLRRTLDWTTPPSSPADDDDDNNDDASKHGGDQSSRTNQQQQHQQQRRRQRALISLLRSLADEPPADYVKGPAISFLEKKARREQLQQEKLWNSIFRRRTLTADELLRRRPAELETPKYTVLTSSSSSSSKNFEIRQYEPYSVCSVSMNKPRPSNAANTTDAVVAEPNLAGARAFGALAGYLFGKNQQETSMKMTTPVLTTQPTVTNKNRESLVVDMNAKNTEQQQQDKSMSFVLPSTYWTATDTAPQPLPDSGVHLEERAPEIRAVIMFGGYASKSSVQQCTKQLFQELRKEHISSQWQPVGDGESNVILAQYNDPFTPPWKRLNEVSILVKQKELE